MASTCPVRTHTGSPRGSCQIRTERSSEAVATMGAIGLQLACITGLVWPVKSAVRTGASLEPGMYIHTEAWRSHEVVTNPIPSASGVIPVTMSACVCTRHSSFTSPPRNSFPIKITRSPLAEMAATKSAPGGATIPATPLSKRRFEKTSCPSSGAHRVRLPATSPDTIRAIVWSRLRSAIVDMTCFCCAKLRNRSPVRTSQMMSRQSSDVVTTRLLDITQQRWTLSKCPSNTYVLTDQKAGVLLRMRKCSSPGAGAERCALLSTKLSKMRAAGDVCGRLLKYWTSSRGCRCRASR
mmetsp:Transcript_26965/g.88486  ORF Transcript_26965/g.88486 Transcript_26965/m.88486 type:complete len:295 (+) Transcript_26965:1037-1921(+)